MILQALILLLLWASIVSAQVGIPFPGPGTPHTSGSTTFSVIAHTSAGSSDGLDVTSSAINTTGANLIVVVASDYIGPGDSVALTDSKSNSWTARTAYGTADNNCRVRIYYSVPTTVGSNHTFILTHQGADNSYPAIAILAVSGSHATPYDTENGATSSSAASLATGSITPSQNSELVVSGLCKNNTATASVNASMTIADQTASGGGTNLGVGLAYIIQTTAGAINPTWSWSGATITSVDIASFKTAVP